MQYINIATTSANLLYYLVCDTLDYFEIKSGKFAKKCDTFNLEKAVESAFDLIGIQMSQKGLHKVIEVDP